MAFKGMLLPNVTTFQGMEHVNNNNNNNNSQCGSRFRGVWGDPDVGNLTSTSISTDTKTDFKRLTK